MIKPQKIMCMQHFMNDTMKVKLLYSYGALLVQGKDQQLESQQLEINFSAWSNEKDYFHCKLFPRVAQGVLCVKQHSLPPKPLHKQFRMTGIFIPPTYKKGCTGSQQMFIQTNVSNSSINGKTTGRCTVLLPPGYRFSLQQTLFYGFPELNDTPFLALGVIFLGLSLTTPKFIWFNYALCSFQHTVATTAYSNDF